MNWIDLEIDCIILRDLAVTPDRAEHIRGLVQVELQRQLERNGLPNGLTGHEVRHLEAPEMHLAEPHVGSHLAGSLAQSVAQALQGAVLSQSK